MTCPITETAPVVASEEEQRFGWLIAQSEEIALTLHPTGTVFRYPYVYGPLPSTFATTGLDGGVGHWSMYGTLTP